MKTVIKLEELVQILLGLYLYDKTDYSWWLFFALIFAPDISIAAYLLNNKVGAILYNIFHHKGIAILIGMLGWIGYYELFIIIGLIMYIHSSMDRVFGFGLKHFDDFKHTHLGWIGKK